MEVLPGRNSGRAAGYISRFGASVLRHHVVGVMAVDLLVLRLAQHGKQAAIFCVKLEGGLCFFRARTFFRGPLTICTSI